jgi:hypothetical protein
LCSIEKNVRLALKPVKHPSLQVLHLPTQLVTREELRDLHVQLGIRAFLQYLYSLFINTQIQKTHST